MYMTIDPTATQTTYFLPNQGAAGTYVPTWPEYYWPNVPITTVATFTDPTAARIEALEKQVAELQRQVQNLQRDRRQHVRKKRR